MAYTPNLFDVENLSLTSYRISIRMVDPTALSSDLSGNQGVLLFDTATDARFSIENMEHILVLGNGLARTALLNKFTFSILEPNGVILMDLIRSTASQLGIQNHLKAIYIIEISFPGRGENSQPKLYSNVFRYPVKFVDFKAQIDATGTKYDVSAIEVSSSAYSYLTGAAKSSITFVGETVGEAIANLQFQLNEAERSAWYTDLSTSIKPNEYVIEFDENAQFLADLRFEQTTEGIETRNIGLVDGRMQFEMYTGSNIHEVIGIILRSTKEFKQIYTFDGGFARENGGHEPSTSTSEKLRTFYKVIANVEYGEFDPLSMDYTKSITFKIKSHINPEMIVDANEFNQTINNPGAQRNMINNLMGTGQLRKRYDYIFTGRNTEVLNLDLKLDQAYFLLSAPFGGQVKHDRLAPTLGQTPIDLRESIRSVKGKIAATSRALGNVSARPPSTGPESFELGQELFQLQDLLRNLVQDFNVQSGINVPVTTSQAVIGGSNTTGPESDTVEASDLQFSAVLANLEKSSDLLTIEMQIRGDPYWLGRPSSFYRTSRGQEQIADYELGGICFFLKLNLPVGTDSNGQRLSNNEYSITGVYRVINVINQFRDGQFTQFLKAVRIPTINTSTVIDELDRPSVLPGASGAPGGTIEQGIPPAEPDDTIDPALLLSSVAPGLAQDLSNFDFGDLAQTDILEQLVNRLT